MPGSLRVLLVAIASDDGALSRNAAALMTALRDFPGAELRVVQGLGKLEATFTRGTCDLLAYEHDPDLADALVDLRRVVANVGDVPILILAGAIGEYALAAAMRAGAADYARHGDVDAIGAALNRLGGLGDELPRRVLRREAYEALRIAEARLRGAFDDAPIGMALAGLDGRFLKLNRALCTLFGYREQDLVGRDFLELTHPEDQQQEDHLIRSLLQGEARSYRIEKRYFHRRGPALWVDQSVLLVRAQDGAPLHFLVQIMDVTAGRKATEALREANARLKAVFDHAPAWMTLSSLDGRFLDANQQLTSLLGTTRERLIGTYAGEHTGPGETLALDADDREVWERREAVSRELTLAAGDGDLRTFQTVRYPVLDESGEVTAIGSFAVDITDQKRSSEAMERALADLTEAQRIAKLGSWAWDSSTGATTWSDELFPIFERDPGSGPCSASDFFGYIVTQERVQVREALSRSFRERVPLQLDCTIRTDGGALRSIHIVGRPDSLRPGIYGAIVQDVTALRAAEREATIAEERFRRAFDDAPVGLTMSDTEGAFLQVNDAFCRMLGYTREELLALSPRELRHDDDIADGDALLVDLRLGMIDRYHRERRLRRGDGSWQWVSVHVTALRNGHGRVEHILSHLIELSDRQLHSGSNGNGDGRAADYPARPRV